MTHPPPDRVLARLAAERTAWLCTLRVDGSPHVTPVWFVHLDGTWWIGSGADNVKVRNVLADPRVSLALMDGDDPVVAEGMAVVHHEDFPEPVVRAFAAKHDGWDLTDPAQPGGPRVLLEVSVRRWLLPGAVGGRSPVVPS